jgi:hypothetical protein
MSHRKYAYATITTLMAITDAILRAKSDGRNCLVLAGLF